MASYERTGRIMIDLLIKGASQVVTCKGGAPKIGKNLMDLCVIEDGSVACKDGKIFWVGKTWGIPLKCEGIRETIDASGKIVIPGLVDPHTHLVFGGSREEEFSMRLKGVPYLEILKQGGGILSTVKKTRASSFEDSYTRSKSWIEKMLEQGTTTVEIKTGYGLDFLNELNMLRVIQSLQQTSDADIVSTFLGAHAWPEGKSHEEYLKELLRMIDHISRERLAEFCDVFCEANAFSLEESRLILERAVAKGMKAKIHAGEFNDLGGADLAADLHATSVDHGEHISLESIISLAKLKIPIVLMPGVNFHLGSKPANARMLITMNAPVALATDFNPGSSPVYSMQFVMQLASRMYGMTPEEVINASTINAAYAIGRHNIVGSIEKGKQADLLILDAPNYNCVPYWIGVNCAETVIKKGRVVKKN